MDAAQRWKRRAFAGVGLFLVGALAAIPLAAIAWPWGFLAYLALLTAATTALIRWHLSHTAFVCPRCGHAFRASGVDFTLSPHVGFHKLLRCPSCESRGWCRATSAGEAVAGGPPRPPASGPAHGPREEARAGRSLRVQMMVLVVAYVVLWLNTFFVYAALPHRATASDPGALFLLPALATVYLAIGLVFLGFAARRGYRSRIYLLLTALVAIGLVLHLGLQYLILAASG